jgi:HSF-type DNA-binding
LISFFSATILQQLNFYSFRKVKYHDSLRIDPEIEKETANYWRFKHENFQRGKPHLLTLIKRTQSATKEGTGVSASASVTGRSASPQPDFPKSSNQINNDTATEVQNLKLRIEEMTKNIDELTAMVKEVSLKQEDSDDYSGASVGYKRKKFSVEGEAAVMDTCMNGPDEIRPDEMLSSMELDEMIALPVPSMPSVPVPHGVVRETSTSTQGSDLAFVDTFFTSFKDEPANDFDDVFIQDADVPPHFSHLPTTSTARETTEQYSINERPDPELMKRLGDALMLLPRDTQEMIINRLIAAITSADFISNISSSSSSANNEVSQQQIIEGKAIVQDVVADAPQTSDEEEKAPYPLAAATLAALLKHYSSQLQRGETSASTNKNGPVAKSIPVIPVHA